jgi:ribosomal protein L7Ae-like RNA K-turn-binding protein
MKDDDRLLSLLCICRKANKLLYGFEASAEAILNDKAAIALIAADTSPKTAKEVKFMAARHGTQVLHIPATQQAIGQKTGRRAGVLAITDKGLAEAVKNTRPAISRANEEDNIW